MLKQKSGRQFKRGHRPWNWKPVGAESINSNGSVIVKVALPDKWRLKHLVIWEKVHGVLPTGCYLRFIDGNRLNVTLDNLAIVAVAAPGEEKINDANYVIVKTSKSGKWRLKHHLVWEEAYGPLRKGERIYFIDGDKRNFNLSNLTKFPVEVSRSILRNESVAVHCLAIAEKAMDLHQTLFDQLALLGNTALTKEELAVEIRKARQISNKAKEVISVNEMQIKLMRMRA